MRVRRPAQTRIPPIIQLAITHIQIPQELPDLRIMPINHGMDPHERQPAPIRGVEMRQLPAMRIRSSRSHEYGLHVRSDIEVVGKGGFHARAGEVCKGQVVGGGRGGDEGVDFREGVRGDDVDGLETGREVGVGMESGEVDDQEDQAVFAAVVGK